MAQISSETVWIGNAREYKETYVTRGASSSPGIERSMNAPRERSGGRKRKRDASLWDVIVDNDDICFTHILPRLNGTDVKFLFGVNEKTRKLIKRSTRKGELKERFKVEEMSSISTLEVAWENKSLLINRVGGTKHISAIELLKRINSSCSSGYERRKSVSGMKDD